MNTKKGTTTVALVLKNSVVFAADKQASAGSVIASRTTRNLFHIDDSRAVAVAGNQGDAQNLTSLLKAEITLKELHENVSVKAVASLVSRMHKRRGYPYVMRPILRGYTGSRVFCDPVGGVTDSAASGMHVHSIKEQSSRLTLNAKGDLANVRSAAQARDKATGGGIALSSTEEYTEFSERKMQKRLKKLR